MIFALVTIVLAAGPPSALECADAFRQRNELSLRMSYIMSREVER